MKNTIFSIVGLLLLVVCSSISGSNPDKTGSNAATTNITVSTSPDLYSLTSTWTAEYMKLNPDVKINLIKVSGSGIKNMANSEAGITFVSSEPVKSEINEYTWKMVVGRDAIVPVMNSSNPYLSQLNQVGVTKTELTKAFTTTLGQNWGTFVVSGLNSPLNIYMISDNSMTAAITSFLSTNKNSLKVTMVANPQELITAIEKDPLSLGFCRMVNMLDEHNMRIMSGISMLPIDKNGNGKLEYSEQIYDNWQTFLRGVWIGKYPQSLCKSIYSLAPSMPVNETEKSFMKWVLADGQAYLSANGYCDLVLSDRQAKIDLLDNTGIAAAPSNVVSNSESILLIFAGFVIAGLFITALYTFLRRRKSVGVKTTVTHDGFINETTVKSPNGLYFDKTHTWVYMEKDGNVRIGIDDFLQHITGNVTRIKMRKTGEKITKGEIILTLIQNGKQLNVKAPVSGYINSHNDLLITNSGIINQSPYGDGWIYEIEPSNWIREIQLLLMADSYRKWITNEFTRIKDFLSAAMQTNSMELFPVVLQDGGELKDNVLTDFGPEVWEDFQTNFLDK